MDFYYIERFSKDEDGKLVPMVMAVSADSDDDARCLLLDCFSDLAVSVDFGEVRKAHKIKNGYLFTRAKLQSTTI